MHEFGVRIPAIAPELSYLNFLIEKILVGARGFEPRASCAQGSCKKSILLVRLALFYVMVHGFGPNWAVVGPKLDPTLLFATRQTLGKLGLRWWGSFRLRGIDWKEAPEQRLM
jgi:hypothetical protein